VGEPESGVSEREDGRGGGGSDGRGGEGGSDEPRVSMRKVTKAPTFRRQIQ